LQPQFTIYSVGSVGVGMPARRKRQKATASRLEQSTYVKRSRTCFSATQLACLNDAFSVSRYLTNSRRSLLAEQLLVSELQVKIWFQNQRAKIKKSARAEPNRHIALQ